MSTLADTSWRSTTTALAAALRRARDARDLSQEDCAREIGISTRSLQAYETGDGPWPQRKTRAKIAVWLEEHGVAA